MKKILLSFVTLLLPIVASAYNAYIDGIYYNFNNSAKTAEVTYRALNSSNQNAYSGTLNIPASVIYNGEVYSVTSIGTEAFSYCPELLNITIPNSISYIAANNFEETGWYINQPDGIVYLDNWVINYKGEKPTGSLTITEGTSGIAELAFCDCNNMTLITIPNSVKYICSRAFEGCSSLTSVIIPDGVKCIRGGTFHGCSSLTTITIPNSVTSIESSCTVNPWTWGAFYGCSGLTSVTFGSGLKTIGSNAFENCKGLISIKIPENVTSIGGYAFSGCSDLISVTIPSSVTYISDHAFSGCESLTSVHISNIEAWCKISFGSGNDNNPLSYAHHLYLGEEEIKDLVIPNSVTSIGNNTFNGGSSFLSVSIPNSVTSIGSYAFSGCRSLRSIIIPNSVTDIGRYAFWNCSGLTSLIISSNVQIINAGTFSGCSSLTEITIPYGVTKIEDAQYYYGNIRNYVGSFDGCSNLISIIIPNSITSIGSYAFRGCRSLKSINIPNSVQSIGESAFQNCSEVETIKLPDELQIIRKATFKGCICLKSVKIPSAVESIYQEAFANCYGLENVNALPSTPPFLYDNSFSNYSVPLKVPTVCKEAYQTAQGWRNFTSISIIDKYSLIYKLDNEFYRSYELEEGATITPEPKPEREGYTFSGWSEIPETMPAHDVTITGSFTANKYNLIYKVDDADYKTYEVEYGATITPEPSPTKVGYNFAGWSEIPETMPDHDVTVSGIFIPKTYLPGDANGDGQITVTDIGVIVDIILGKTPANARKQQEAEPQ